MKTNHLLIAIMLLAEAAWVRADQLQTGHAFAEETVTAQKLNDAVNKATAQPGLISEQSELTSPGIADEVLVLNHATSPPALKRVQVGNVSPLVQALGNGAGGGGFNSTIPYDNTVPTITEGAAVWSNTITPKSASDTILVDIGFAVTARSGAITVIAAVFRASTCINVQIAEVPATWTLPLRIVTGDHHYATTSAVTYSVRIGTREGGFFDVGLVTGSPLLFGGLLGDTGWNCWLYEIKP